MPSMYPSSLIPVEYRNPDINVLLIPCWNEYYDIEVIEVPDDWEYPLPELPSPLAPPPTIADLQNTISSLLSLLVESGVISAEDKDVVNFKNTTPNEHQGPVT